MTMDRNSVAHSLVRFFLAHGSVLPLLDVLTYREIQQTSEERGREGGRREAEREGGKEGGREREGGREGK